MAATKDQVFYQRASEPGARYEYPVAAGVQIFKNAIVGLNAAFQAVPAGSANAVAVVGLASDPADNRAGNSGDKRVIAKTGTFEMSDAFAAAPGAVAIKGQVFAADDATLSLTNAADELLLGTIDAIDEEGVWVSI